MNAYKVDLPTNLDISPVFNVFDLYIFHRDSLGDDSEERMDCKHAISRNIKENIPDILDKETLHTQQGQYNWYLVQWEGLTPIENTWITEGDLLNLDIVKQKNFEDNNLQELRSF